MRHLIVTILLLSFSNAWGIEISPLTAGQKSDFEELVRSIATAREAIEIAHRKDSVSHGPLLDQMSQILINSPCQFQFQYKTAPGGEVDTSMSLEASGNSCPVNSAYQHREYDLFVSPTYRKFGGKLNFKYVASQAAYLALNDIVSIDLRGKGSGEMWVVQTNGEFVVASAKTKGQIQSQKFGLVKVAQKGLINARRVGGRVIGGGSSNFYFFFPNFTVELKEVVAPKMDDLSSKCYLNNQEMNCNQAYQYFVGLGFNR